MKHLLGFGAIEKICEIAVLGFVIIEQQNGVNLRERLDNRRY